jgi:hypothetical protein
MTTAQSKRDLNKKLRFESILRPKLRRYNNKITREFRARFRKDGTIVSMSSFDDELTAILEQHYRRVGSVFSNNMSPQLPDDVAITDSERGEILAALAAWYLLAPRDNAKQINKTTRTNMSDSVVEAEQDPLVLQQTGKSSLITAAVVAGALLARKLRGRESTILMSETQLPAQVAKITEVEVLSGITPSITQQTRATVPVNKTWVTQGDSLVRPSHVAADGQTVPINRPYTVGGELLMTPGDMSLGASLENIINCRCESQYNRQDVVILRRGG